MKLNTTKAVTLIEVIVAVVIVGLVSVTSWMAVSVLMRSAEISRNRTIAVDLLQKSQEEVRRTAQVETVYDDLQNCVFPPQAGNTCGFDDIADIIGNPEFEAYEDFVRDLDVTLQEGSSELKRALISVSWQEMGETKLLQSVVLLSRPPDALPGNIRGQVTDTAGQLILGVRVTVKPRDGSGEYTAVSQAAVDPTTNANYDFAQPTFILEAGTWQLSSEEDLHSDYDHPDDILVEPELSTIVNFSMEPKPIPATIRIRLIHGESGLPIIFGSSSRIQLYESGSLYRDRSRTGLLVIDDIDFDDGDETRSFTVATNNAYLSNYVGNFACTAGTTVFAPGWSSAIVDSSHNINCGNPRQGSAATDRITVGPGDDITVDVPLFDIPMAIVEGYVRDNFGNPIEDADIYVRFHQWTRFYPYPFRDVTDSNGFYSIQVPAEQEMFIDNTNYYLLMLARGTVTIRRCCDIVGSVSRYNIGGWQRVGPLRAGQVIQKDFVISGDDLICGDVEGNVINDFSGGPISQANVRISGTEQTDGSGYYLFACDPGQTGYSITQGYYTFRSQRNGFYENYSRGNTWYARQSDVHILENLLIPYDAKMWPMGYGVIRGTVQEKGTGTPIQNIDVRLSLYNGNNDNRTTNNNGQFAFDQVLESWPPPTLPVGDPYYRYNDRRHGVRVTDNSGIYLPYSQGNISLNNGQTVNLTIELEKQGGM